MNTRIYLLLFAGGLLLSLVVARFQSYPGYLDADYYYVGGVRLATGYGFSEPFIWNYLNDPPSVVHPSHAYWMPLASIIAAASMLLTGQETYAGARWLFLAIAACVPPLTALLSFALSRRAALAIVSGLLAIFSVYHAPFVGVTDNFGVFMVLGGLYFLLVLRSGDWLWLGVLSGLMNLARADGVLWLVLTLGLSVAQPGTAQGHGARARIVLVVLAGYLVVMMPWYLRNISAFGAPVAPGGSRVLWLRSYEEIFTFPASSLSYETWLADGWGEVLRDRVWAASRNLQNAIAAQGAILLFPFILVGIWWRRSQTAVRLSVAGWLVLFLVMTILLPFPGARGGFFHAGAAFQPMWWALAPIGLEAVVTAARRRGMFTSAAHDVFRGVMVLTMVILTAYVGWIRIGRVGWGEGEAIYPGIEQALRQRGAGGDDVVIVRNPAGYYLATGRPAIVIPSGGPDTIQAAASRYQARFLVLEPQGTLPETRVLYEEPRTQTGYQYLGEVDGTRLFEIVGP